MKIRKLNKIAQEQYEGGGYLSINEEDIPDSITSYIGSGSVDYSRLASKFSKVSEVVQLVNQFNSSLLRDIAYVFDFSGTGAYGVYLTELTRAIKNKIIRRELQDKGYEVDIQNGQISAIDTNGEKTEDQIGADIQEAQRNQDSKGGMAFGINMDKIVQAANDDAMRQKSKVESMNEQLPEDQQIVFDENVWQWLMAYHLASTIVHEAVHAQGHMDEGAPTQAEDQFASVALPHLNDLYKQTFNGEEKDFVPIEFSTTEKRQAQAQNWYKVAQGYSPPSFFEAPRGSDLSGRFPTGPASSGGLAPWGMVAQMGQNEAIESRLNRKYMAPLPEGLSQENDSIELQLRKYTIGDERIAPDDSLEEVLSMEHDDDDTVAYEAIESLLDDTRPKPLLVPIEKMASTWYAKTPQMIKEATTFGWYNNLEISDGNTIPGLSDRVMLWSDTEEGTDDDDFTWSGEKIREQSRYNPSYSSKGFYYVFQDIRGWPYSADKGARDMTNTHPLSRMASNDSDIEISQDVIEVIRVINIAKIKINKGEIMATRLVMSDDIFPLLDDILEGAGINTRAYVLDYGLDGKELSEDAYAVWMFVPSIDDVTIDKCEKYLRSDATDKDMENMLERLFRNQQQRSSAIKEVVSETRNICNEYGIKDVYIVGGYPRDLIMGTPICEIDDLDFSGTWPNQSTKVGGLLAERLGVLDTVTYHRTGTLAIPYKSIKVEFKGNFSPMEIREQLRERGIPTTTLNFDIYNRDFTINTLVYNVFTDKIVDVTGEAKDDIKNKIIRTVLDADFVCSNNPLVILRALKFKIRYGFDIDSQLEEAMKKHVNLLFDGRYSDERLMIGRENVKKEGVQEAKQFFEEFGLNKLEEM